MDQNEKLDESGNPPTQPETELTTSGADVPFAEAAKDVFNLEDNKDAYLAEAKNCLRGFVNTIKESDFDFGKKKASMDRYVERAEKLLNNVEGKKYKDMDEFLADEKNKIAAINLAESIRDIVGRNWFDLAKYMRKTKRPRNTAVFQLSLLTVFDLCVVKHERGENIFKIDINQEARKELLLAQIAQAELNIKIYKNHLEKIDAD